MKHATGHVQKICRASTNDNILFAAALHPQMAGISNILHKDK